MGEWKTYRLGNVAEINPKVPIKLGKEYSFIEMKDLEPSRKIVLPSVVKEFKSGSKFENGDTLFARITPCLENGKICQAQGLKNGIGFGSTEFLVFRGIKNVSDSDFIYYLTRSEFVRNSAIQAMTGTSGRQRVEKGALEKLEISIPDINEQQRISSILSSLDDKIELNLQMNETLEAIAQGIFKEWFVDFKFPGFDGKLVDGLPKGWRYDTIGNIGIVVTGKTPSVNNPEHFGDFMPFVTPSDFKSYGKIIIDSERYLSKEGSIAFSKKILLKDSVIVTCIGSDMGKVIINKIECVTNQQINSIIPNKDVITTNYLYFILANKYEYLRNLATGGSTMPIINKTQFEQIEILLPSITVLRVFQGITNSLSERVEYNILQNQTLTQLRDNLLPKLMNGKIKVTA